MKNFQQLKQDMEVDIDGMLVNEKEKTSSILRKFLLFNLSIFSVLGLFTILYLNAIQPNLVKKVSESHFIIINTSDHIERLELILMRKVLNSFYFLRDFFFKALIECNFFLKMLI